jgi:predicted RNA-binding protein with PUA-like domain
MKKYNPISKREIMALIFPMDEQNFEISKKNLICGARTVTQNFKNVQKGDLVFFYIKAPVQKIFGIYKAKSLYFSSSTKIWPKDVYPHRVEIDIVEQFERGIPLSEVIANKKISIKSYFSFLRGVKYITKEEAKELANVFK